MSTKRPTSAMTRFDRVTPPKASASIVREIVELILLDILRSSRQLPAERVLAKRAKVSRSSLHDALVSLESRGLPSAQQRIESIFYGRAPGYAVPNLPRARPVNSARLRPGPFPQDHATAHEV